MRQQAGFSLIEAIVAMALVGTVGIALFSWVYSSTNSVHRIETANARSLAMSEAIEFMQSINPMQHPEGKSDFGTYQISWKAEPISARIDGVNYPKGQGLYEFSLYIVHIAGRTNDDEDWFKMDLKLVGYKKTRTLGTPFGAFPSKTQ